MVIRDFKINIKTENIMYAVDCRTDSPVYAHVLSEYDKYKNDALKCLEPAAWIEFDSERCYIVMTVGEKISRLSEDLFAKGEAMAGLLVNAVGDEYIFEMEKTVSERVKSECAKRGLGVKERLEAPADMPLEMQQELIEKSGAAITVNEAMQLVPAKSMGYMLVLTKDKGIFNAQHDCSKCTAKNCPRRTTPFNANEFEILSSYKGTLKMAFGTVICIDIGTTTIVMELLQNGIKKAEYRCVNPQRRFGADVLSRIEAANRGRLKELKNLISYEILKGVREMGDNVDKIVISANTVMVHLLMGYSCESLGRYPFTPVNLDTIHITLGELTGTTHEIPVHIIGGIGAFVGGDIVSGIYCSKMAESTDISLFVDLGTNGEMALGCSERIIAASTAAGPAFEGGGISCGIGSVKGAVCGVDLKTGTLKTIGDTKPCGVCGTGIIELTAQMLDGGIMDKTGLLAKRWFEDGFPIYGDTKFTQKDIREVQTAKSAVISGVETLIKEYGINQNDISGVYLAGGFGYGLNISMSQRIGLLPDFERSKIKIIGNSSIGGAVRYAYENGADDEISRIKAISTDIVLGNDEYFAKRYIENINFV